jgi:O-antigen/teichoic acid export membrane protein
MEYIALPIAMLLATPFLLHRLGSAQYGLWMFATAAITSSSFISTGFGDAALKYVATYRGANDRAKVADTLRVNLTINLALGSLLAVSIWYGAPFAVHYISLLTPDLQTAAVAVFRIGSVVLLVRSIESVFVAALRAYERYGPTVHINVAMRVATIVSACVLVAKGRSIVAVMVATLVFTTLSCILQGIGAWAVLGALAIYPYVKPAAFAEVFRFGCFSWLQALAGCVFSYADRLLIGFMLGASAVAYYSVCVQAAQPIHGLIAAGLHFIFPHLSGRLSSGNREELRLLISKILAANLVLTTMLCLPVVFLSKSILRIWMGAAFAEQNWMVLSVVAVGFGLLACNITGHYALLAMEQVRLVSLLNVVGGVFMLAGVFTLAGKFGLMGAAIGRLLYGPVTLLMYFRLWSMMAAKSPSPIKVSASPVTAESSF